MTRLHLLHTNDIHSHLEKIPSLYEKITALRERCQQAGEPVLLVDGGDHADRARLETEGTNGQVNLQLLKAFAYDAITLGNNELLSFDRHQLQALYQNAPFAVLCSNLLDMRSQALPQWCQKYSIVQKGEWKIGLIGVSAPINLFYHQLGWTLTPPLEAIAEEVVHLRPNVDLVVVLSHVGYSFDVELAQNVPGIDVIVGAHTHHLLQQGEKVEDTLLVAAGKFGEYLGHVQLELAPGQSPQVQQVDCWPIETTSESSPVTEKILSTAYERAKKELSQVIAHLEQPLEIDWQTESPFANLLADSLTTWVGVEAAIVNSGLLLHSLPKGEVTLQDLHRICPHPINPVLLKLKGRDIRMALQESMDHKYRDLPIRGFGFRGQKLGGLAVSGMRVEVKERAKQTPEIGDIYILEELLSDEQEYMIASVDMFLFGVGYQSLQHGTVLRICLPEFIRSSLQQHLARPEAFAKCQQKRFVRE